MTEHFTDHPPDQDRDTSEGFGTLDEETLEEVMTVLDTLREGGRMVGIVSHVAELRQRIPAQLQVRKTRAGSTVHLIAP